MACIRKRRGKWVVDYRDAAGVRRWVTCPTRREAETVLEGSLRDARQPSRPVVDPNITVALYADRWLAQVTATLKPRTVERYRETLRLHLCPRLGTVTLRLLQRGTIKALLAAKLTERPGARQRPHHARHAPRPAQRGGRGRPYRGQPGRAARPLPAPRPRAGSAAGRDQGVHARAAGRVPRQNPVREPST